MPNDNQAEDHIIIETTSNVNAAIYSAVSTAIDKAPAPIKAGLFLLEQSGGVLQISIANDENQGQEIAEFIGRFCTKYL